MDLYEIYCFLASVQKASPNGVITLQEGATILKHFAGLVDFFYNVPRKTTGLAPWL